MNRLWIYILITSYLYITKVKKESERGKEGDSKREENS